MSFSRCVVAMMAAVSSTAHADVLFVDNCTQPGGGLGGGTFPSIQAAIDAAADGDEVVVAPCTYFESIDFLGKAITLRSSDGAQVTTIDGTGSVHVVRCISGEGPETVLDGFTITGGHADVNGTFPDNSGGDVGMVHNRQGLALGLEAGDHLLRVHTELDDLQRHPPADGLLLLGEVDNGEAALADLLQDLVVAEALIGPNLGSVPERHGLDPPALRRLAGP